MDFRNKWIAPKLVYIKGEFIDNFALKINQDGKIETILERDNVPIKDKIVELPSFVNAHSHAFHRELRGRSEIGGKGAENFWKWRDNMYKLVEEANFEKIKKYCISTFTEMLRAGITTVGEFHYVHHGREKFDLDLAVIEAAKETGIRLVLIETLYCRSGFNDSDVNHHQIRFKSNIDEFIEHIHTLKSSNLPPNVTLAVAAHSLRAVPTDQLKRLYAFSVLENLPFHVHLEEQPKEIQDCEEVECCTPSELLLSLLPDVDKRLTAVHCTYTKRKNLNVFDSKYVNVCICPLTEGFLGDGIPHLESEDKLCLGTDCNNRICFWEEMRWLAYGQNMKNNSRNAAKLDATKLLKIATINGAISLGLSERVGQICSGFEADFFGVDLDTLLLKNIQADELADALIFGCGNSEIKRVIVAGVQH